MSNFSESIFRKDFFEEALFKNLTVVMCGIIINYINGTLLYTFFNNPIFYRNTRYILYMQLVVNDIIMLFCSVLLHVLGYVSPFLNVHVCIILLLIVNNTYKNTPLNLAGMSLERFVAICYPLQHALICTVDRAYIVIMCIWIVGALPGFIDLIVLFVGDPSLLSGPGRLCYHVNIFYLTYHYDNTFASNLTFMCFVWITLIYTYVRVMMSAKAAVSNPILARKAQITILLHGVQMLLCMLSYITPLIDNTLVGAFPKFRSVILFCTFIVANIIPRLLSPLIYGLRDEKFKKYMKRSLLCRQNVPNVKPENEN